MLHQLHFFSFLLWTSLSLVHTVMQFSLQRGRMCMQGSAYTFLKCVLVWLMCLFNSSIYIGFLFGWKICVVEYIGYYILEKQKAFCIKKISPFLLMFHTNPAFTFRGHRKWQLIRCSLKRLLTQVLPFKGYICYWISALYSLACLKVALELYLWLKHHTVYLALKGALLTRPCKSCIVLHHCLSCTSLFFLP